MSFNAFIGLHVAGLHGFRKHKNVHFLKTSKNYTLVVLSYILRKYYQQEIFLFFFNWGDLFEDAEGTELQ